MLNRKFGRFWPSRTLAAVGLFFLLATDLTTVRGHQAAEQELDFDKAQAAYLKGAYADTLIHTQPALTHRTQKGNEDWWILRIRALLALGRYEDARADLEQSLKHLRYAVRIRVLGHDVYRRLGQAERAKDLLRQIDYLVSRAPGRYSDRDNMVAVGRTALLLGADPKAVLETLFDRAKAPDPLSENERCKSAYLATGQLALDKHDDQVAAQSYTEAIQHFPNDPDLYFGLARALASSDGEKADAALKRALELNPRHAPSLLLQVENLIDGEKYEQAEVKLTEVLNVNPWNPRAWAFRAVLAHLRGDVPHKLAAREAALRFWDGNPAVDHLIGRKLSQKYRFAEGEKHQRQALDFDESYLPAKIQLAQDLLRLGREDEGWKLVGEVQGKDEYDVVAFNLTELQDRIAQFKTLESGGLIVRMESHEADVYGDQVLALLADAKKTLCPKYGLKLDEPVIVEIFPDQSDFAVRTFGMPGGAGYLGVCFGTVITANSPASRKGNPTNWRSVLWHEFCHVVTLKLTRNRMPRWLSEGISVYEERQVDPAWGEQMTPRYCKMIRDGELTPVGDLSAAFLSPKSSVHLMFAYFESSLVVEFLIDQFGLEALKAILQDLGAQMPINLALQRHTGWPIEKIEREFEQHARRLADEFAPDVDFSPVNFSELASDAARDPQTLLQNWLDKHPGSYDAMVKLAQGHIRNKEWDQAKGILQRILKLFPEGEDPYRLLAQVHRSENNLKAERETLESLATLSAASLDAYARLAELALKEQDWSTVYANAQRSLAVDPLTIDPHQYLAKAAEALNRPTEAIGAYRRVLLLDPKDPADVHFRLARLLQDVDSQKAKRHVLMSLENAPRYRAAQRLLLKLHDHETAQSIKTPATQNTP